MGAAVAGALALVAAAGARLPTMCSCLNDDPMNGGVVETGVGGIGVEDSESRPYRFSGTVVASCGQSAASMKPAYLLQTPQNNDVHREKRIGKHKSYRAEEDRKNRKDRKTPTVLYYKWTIGKMD